MVTLSKGQIPSYLMKFFRPKRIWKPKDDLMLPHRLYDALMADGWYGRSAITLCKNNPMPESVQDRPTSATEMLFMLTKQSSYFYDADAIREKSVDPPGVSRGGSLSRFGPDEQLVSANGHRGSQEYRSSGCRNKRNWWVLNSQPLADAHFACVDEETECLTIEGWKNHEELRPGMLAAQYDIESGNLSWAPIEDVARYQVQDQPMVVAQNRDVQMVLTPNHRTLIARRHCVTRKFQDVTVIRADALKTNHAVPISGTWYEMGEEPVSPDWAELIGWYIAEGCETLVSWSVEIYQSHTANAEKANRIRWLLDRVGAEYIEARTTRQWRGRETGMTAFQVRGFAAAYLRQWAPGKKFHPTVLQWDSRLLSRLLDGLVDGDGHRRPDGRFSFVQRSKDSVDTVQAIGVRLGYATMVSWRSTGTYVLYFTRKRLLSFRGTAGEGAEIKQQPYSGIVWCPKLPAGTWVARRGGRSFITGNTFPEKLVEPCLLAGTSEWGVCVECGSPWKRVVEDSEEYREAKKRGKMVGGHGTTRSMVGGRAMNKGDAPSVTKSQVTTGWEPTCQCDTDQVEPALCLDPFAGSGTVCKVATRLGRRSIGIELNEEYVDIAWKRNAQLGLML